MESNLPTLSTVITPDVSDIDPAPNIPDSPITVEERVSGVFANLVLMRAERRRKEEERLRMKEEYKVFMKELKKKECQFKRDSTSPYEVPTSQNTADGNCRGHDVNTSKIKASNYSIPEPAIAPAVCVTRQASGFIPSSTQTTPLLYVTIDMRSPAEVPVSQPCDMEENEGDVADASGIESSDDDVELVGEYIEDNTPTGPCFRTDSEWVMAQLEDEARCQEKWEEEAKFHREEEEKEAKIKAQFESIQNRIDKLKKMEKGKGKEIDPLTVTPPNQDLEEVYEGKLTQPAPQCVPISEVEELKRQEPDFSSVVQDEPMSMPTFERHIQALLRPKPFYT